jgi:transposase-like protein
MEIEEYPRNLMELESKYSNEQDCRDYLFRLRWPEGFVCPRCSCKEYIKLGALYRCKKCRHQISVTAGTVFHRSHIPLPVWFRAIWWVSSQKNGASALGLKRVLGLGSYETAWLMLHKLRRSMVRPGRDKLSGSIEIDETFIGGLEEGLRGRGAVSKALVAIVAQVKDKNIGRIRLKRIPDASAFSLETFIQESVDTGSLILTDGWNGYNGVSDQGYKHRVINLTKRRKTASTLLPRVHRVASLLKRWLMGTHQGAVSCDHLDYYLDEFTFRFNLRTSQSRGKLFYRLLQQAGQTGHVEYRRIIKNIRGLSAGKHNR